MAKAAEGMFACDHAMLCWTLQDIGLLLFTHSIRVPAAGLLAPSPAQQLLAMGTAGQHTMQPDAQPSKGRGTLAAQRSKPKPPHSTMKNNKSKKARATHRQGVPHHSSEVSTYCVAHVCTVECQPGGMYPSFCIFGAVAFALHQTQCSTFVTKLTLTNLAIRTSWVPAPQTGVLVRQHSHLFFYQTPIEAGHQRWCQHICALNTFVLGYLSDGLLAKHLWHFFAGPCAKC